MEEAKLYITHVKQMKFAKEHLLRVMNMDFDKPTQKLRKMAKETNINLKDPKVIAEFKVIQQQTLNDIQRMKDGKQPLTEEESKEERARLLKERNEQHFVEHVKKQQEAQQAEDKKTKDILKLFKENKSALDSANDSKKSVWRDMAILTFIFLIWVAAMIYMNYFMPTDTAAEKAKDSKADRIMYDPVGL